MHITRIDPANMLGNSGRRIEELENYLRHTSSRLRSDMPDFHRLVLLSARADGERIPKIGFVGNDSHIRHVMEGRFGGGYNSAIRNQDPRFDQAVAAGFAQAAKGHPVFEHVELEVTPPGALKPIVASYYRAISLIEIGPVKTLVNLTLPTFDVLDLGHQFRPDREYHQLS